MARLSIGLLIASAVMLVASGCAVNPVTGRQELALFSVSASQEISLGQQAFPKAVQQMGGEFRDPALQQYVDRVGQRLGQASQRPELPYQFKVVNDSTPNAFALPGGSIAITRGLLVNMENEAQLASVLGHEIGHVTARDSVQAMQRGTLMGIGLAVLGATTGQAAYGALAQQAGALAAGLLENSYSREQERQADRLGIDYMVQAGYDPQGGVQLQEFFYRKLEGGAEPMWLAGLFRTHPFSKERMDNVEAYIQQRYADTRNNPRYVMNTDAFRSATARLRQTKPAYDLYDKARELERSGQLSQAIVSYQQAATALPDEPLILTGLGMAYLRAENITSARPHLQRAVQLDSGYFQSRFGLGFIHLKENRVADAVRELEASMELMPTTQAGYMLGGAYEKQGNRAKALEMYKAVAGADPRGQYGQAATKRIGELERK